ncbi:hypothetical protein [Thermococcus celer]|uniref:hypothetical protein n=1 Tax=Thermococcus celer TaxID=2264 RepID=UPI000A459993|nr:hypothetical protein [Thermococcus celer]
MKVVADTSAVFPLFSSFYPELITNDKKMAELAKMIGLRAFYLVDEADDFFELLGVNP